MYLLGAYTEQWNSTAIDSARKLFLSFASCSFITASVFYCIEGLNLYLLNLIFFDNMLSFSAAGLTRISPKTLSNKFPMNQNSGVKTVILGAGEAGSIIALSFQKGYLGHLNLIGFIDDDPNKKGHRIHGLSVLGSSKELSHIIHSYDLQQIIIAIPSASSKRIKDLLSHPDFSQVKVLTAPSLPEIFSGEYKVSQIREFDIEDLLGRSPVESNLNHIKDDIQQKSILVTGAGGSIGSELCRQISSYFPDKLILLGHGENSIFSIYNQLVRKFPELAIFPVIADLRDIKRLRHIFNVHQPHIVFHAAAHKHVPLMEANIPEAISNNILSVKNLLIVSEESGVSSFVGISSDKAINPTNIMGATKFIMECLVHEAGIRLKKRYACVRFGNVLGSRGSVVQTFKDQIARGGPVTVTDREIVRYFMTIPEACQLVLEAFSMGQSGDVFVLDMGTPMKIYDLAKEMINLSGKSDEVEIVITGLRPGEKMNEELFSQSELPTQTEHSKIFKSNTNIDLENIHIITEEIIELSKDEQKEKIICKLREAVPGFTHD